MSTAHGLFVPESDSKALFPTAPSSKPTSEIIPHTCHINHEHPKEEQQEEEIIIPTTTTTAAAVVSVSVTLDTEENNKEAKDVTVEFCDDSEDDGYRTPTSPRHRILVDMKYPPPPPKKKKQPSSRLLYAKRKKRTARARVRVDIDGEISSLFLCVGLLDETSRRRKKAKTF